MHTRPTIRELEAHRDLHASAGAGLAEVILGGQDGLVNVLGVILGVAAASADQRIILAAGLAATFAESVSMAASVYTSQRVAQDYYRGQLEREKEHIRRFAAIEREEIRRIYAGKGFDGDLLETIVDRITADEETWIEEMMTQEFNLSPVEQDQPLRLGLIVGMAAIAGSLIPLAPFVFLPVAQAVVGSLVVAGLTLFAVGFYKARATQVGDWRRSGLEMAIIGLASALVGYLVGWLFRVPAA